MTEQRQAKLTEVKDFFETKQASQFTKEWRELSVADQEEIKILIAEHNDNS